MGCDRSVMVERQVETARNEPKSRRAYPGNAVSEPRKGMVATWSRSRAAVVLHGWLTTWRLVFDGQVAKKSF